MDPQTLELLPEVQPPSLEGLSVQVRSPQPPSAEELTERLHGRLRQGAPRRERRRGEPIQWGDDVEYDLIGVVAGRILPGCVRQGVTEEMRALPHLPGLVEGMVGMETLSAKTIELTLPDSYPVAELRGQPATFYVEARRAFAVDMPALHEPAALQAAGLGQTLESAMEILAQEIDGEQGDELLVEATECVLDALADRVQVDIPRALVDAELRSRWESTEGKLLAEKQMAASFQAGALEDFLHNPGLRWDAYRRLKINLALGALVKAHNLKPSAQDVNGLMNVAAERLGLGLAEVKQSLREEPAEARRVTETALYLAAVQFVMARAKIQVDD